MRLIVPEHDSAVASREAGHFLHVLRRAAGVGFVVLARPGGRLLVAGGEGPEGCEAVGESRLFRVAAALRQRLAIEDLEASAEFGGATLPGATRPLRFFASVPLLSPAGTSLGALCVLDPEPRALDDMAAPVARLEDGAPVLLALLAAEAAGAEAARSGLDLARAEGEARVHAAVGERYRKIYERMASHARIGVWECDLATQRHTWTDGIYDIFALPRGGRISRHTVLPLYDHASRRELERLRQRAMETGEGFTLDVRVRDLRGVLKWVRVSAEVEMESGRPARLFGLMRDMTAERDLHDRLHRHAECDALTGLANRAAFERALAAHRGSEPEAVLLLGLDGFRAVNGTFGHAAGDACLVEVAVRLRRVFRGAELVARVGGDEFAVLVRGVAPVADLDGRAAAAVAAISVPVSVEGREIRLGASLAVARDGDADAAAGGSLFARADEALSRAKPVRSGAAVPAARQARRA
ncbi:GGDEF domain-containing protein [Xanthobacter sp. V0B-10]|uniref:diguanylate cyclase domain-containing protein n=1 Tax=Xanthobacter albus TaxID=3119929 RepID=UPI0037288282